MRHNAERELTRFFVDEDDAAIVPVVLAGDECFQEKARLVAAAEDRRSKAESEAKSYVPYGGIHRGARRDLIVQLLLEAAEEPDALGRPEMRDSFANRHRRAVWAELEALTEFDPCRVRERGPMLNKGAHFLANFGAFKCLECRTPFAKKDRYELVGASRRRSRRKHCDVCEKKLGTLATSQIDEMCKALDAATGRRRRLRLGKRELERRKRAAHTRSI